MVSVVSSKMRMVSEECGGAPEGGWAPERGDPPEGGVAALPTTSAGGDFGDNGL